MVMTRTDTLLEFYRDAEHHVRAAGFGWELEWQRERMLQDFTEQDLLRESAWVILCSGFREAVVRKAFDYVSLCFCDWESAKEISQSQDVCIETAAWRFGNRRKLKAIASIAEIVHDHGFGSFQAYLKKDPINKLQALPFIGPITSWHLAKNLGFDVAKNDRHLSRVAHAHGFSNAQSLCSKIAVATGESSSVIDIVLWRFATLKPEYQAG
jgi:endonuclease III